MSMAVKWHYYCQMGLLCGCDDADCHVVLTTTSCLMGEDGGMCCCEGMIPAGKVSERKEVAFSLLPCSVIPMVNHQGCECREWEFQKHAVSLSRV